ncbi:hypothetical protein SARC_06131 [Sphaeroforma arctica JP610]|uniref:Uncharacterized protein n=1 Tax=Sphaeroforma arctica JP610 TaxID=667725 RepID=A0A0L0FYC2_9EUKA|nr:hypothetical protein SARC_06131 [Sphaeroforma arctica JP610]KNC81556.1 hypothetical protein SARC_06131 [Sphaeroforma arctica JP610]|eukprot:XP_014155458.1 hypothetical protein SARC_06131 [Sphaeroforma arctica JP610]
MSGVGNNAITPMPSQTTLNFYGNNSNESFSETMNNDLASAINLNKSKKIEKERERAQKCINRGENGSTNATASTPGSVIRIKKGRKSAGELLRKATAEETLDRYTDSGADENVSTNIEAIYNHRSDNGGVGINSEMDAPLYIHSQGNNSAVNPLQAMGARIKREDKTFIDSSDSEHQEALQSNLLANVSRVNRTPSEIRAQQHNDNAHGSTVRSASGNSLRAKSDYKPAVAVRSPHSGSMPTPAAGTSRASAQIQSRGESANEVNRETPRPEVKPRGINTSNTSDVPTKPKVKPRPNPRPRSCHLEPVNTQTTSEQMHSGKMLKGVSSTGDVHLNGEDVSSLFNTPEATHTPHMEPLGPASDYTEFAGITSSPAVDTPGSGEPRVKSILFSRSVYDEDVMLEREQDKLAPPMAVARGKMNQLAHNSTLTSLAPVTSDQPQGDVMAKLGFARGDSYFRADSPTSVPSASVESFSKLNVEPEVSKIAVEVQHKLDARKQAAAQLGVKTRTARPRGNTPDSKRSSRGYTESDNEQATGGTSTSESKSKKLANRLSMGGIGNVIFNSSKGSVVGGDDMSGSDSSMSKDREKRKVKEKKLASKPTKGLGREAWEERIRNEKRSQEAQREYEMFQRQLSEEKKLLLLAEYKAIREDRVANRYKEKMDKKAEKKMQKQLVIERKQQEKDQERIRKEEHKLAARQMKQLEKQGKGVNGFVRGTSITVPTSSAMGNPQQLQRPRSISDFLDDQGDNEPTQDQDQGQGQDNQLKHRGMQRPGQMRSMHQMHSPSTEYRPNNIVRRDSSPSVQPNIRNVQNMPGMRGNQPQQGSNIIRRSPSGNVVGGTRNPASQNNPQNLQRPIARGSPLQTRQSVQPQQRRPVSGANGPNQRARAHSGGGQTASPMQSQDFRRFTTESSTFRAARPASQMITSHPNQNPNPISNPNQNPYVNSSNLQHNFSRNSNMGMGGTGMGSASYESMPGGDHGQGQYMYDMQNQYVDTHFDDDQQ